MVKKQTKKRVEVTQESSTGRNEKFYDNQTGTNYTRNQFVQVIEQNKDGLGEIYHVAIINGVPTPRSNPNGNEADNLG